MSQHYASKANSNTQQENGIVPAKPNIPESQATSISTTSTKTNTDSAKKRKSKRGKLAISFGPPTTSK